MINIYDRDNCLKTSNYVVDEIDAGDGADAACPTSLSCENGSDDSDVGSWHTCLYC